MVSLSTSFRQPPSCPPCPPQSWDNNIRIRTLGSCPPRGVAKADVYLAVSRRESRSLVPSFRGKANTRPLLLQSRSSTSQCQSGPTSGGVDGGAGGRERVRIRMYMGSRLAWQLTPPPTSPGRIFERLGCLRCRQPARSRRAWAVAARALPRDVELSTVAHVDRLPRRVGRVGAKHSVMVHLQLLLRRVVEAHELHERDARSQQVVNHDTAGGLSHRRTDRMALDDDGTSREDFATAPPADVMVFAEGAALSNTFQTRNSSRAASS